MFRVAHILAGLRDLGSIVEFMWAPSHVGLVGNEVADRVAGAAREIPYCIQYGVSFCDLYDPIGRDFEAWVGLLWPYLETGGASCSRYFDQAAYKSARPWFSHMHICTGDHFQRMGWDLEAGCSCGAPLRDLVHILHVCPLLAESRPGFYAFLSTRFPDRKPEEIPIEDLVFDPVPGVVGSPCAALALLPPTPSLEGRCCIAWGCARSEHGTGGVSE